MNNSQLVFISPNYIKAEPFTTSDVIAEYSEIKHHAIQQLIKKHENDFQEFGKVAFEMRASTESVTGQSEKVYHLNEQQAMLLLTYLKNTEPVRQFKKSIVKAFYQMKNELFNRKSNRKELVPIHKDLAEAVKHIPEHPSSKHDYSKYNNLAYMILFGMSAKKLKTERGAGKNAVAADYLSADEMERVAQIKDRICMCLEMGMNYSEIKDRLSNITALRRTA